MAGKEEEMDSDKKCEGSKLPEPEIIQATGYTSYPKLDPEDVNPPAENWASSSFPPGSNPYVAPSPIPAVSSKNKVEAVKDVLGKWGQKASGELKRAEDFVGNVWQHLKTGPNVAEAAVGRIAQEAKVIAEGGHEKIFRQTFECFPDEKFLNSFACYLSTSAGPVMGILYLSSAKLAFCSDNPLSYIEGQETRWSYYKVILPLSQLKLVNPSTNNNKPTEKYIQVVSVDNHEFWFMGFVYYDKAVKFLKDSLPHVNV